MKRKNIVFLLILIILNVSFPIIIRINAETHSQTRLINNVISAEWTNPENAFTENDLCTYTNINLANNYYNFINNPFTIPEGATINGIRAEWRWGGDGNDWFTLALRDASPAWAKAWGQPPDVGCADAVLIGAGSSTNLWGATWTPAHINSANFRCWFQYEKSGKANFINIDYMEVTVWYEYSPEVYDPDLLFGAGFNASSPYVELYWNHSLINVDFFEVQNSSDGISWEYLGQNTITEYTDYQVLNGTERYYKVRSCKYESGEWYNSSFSNVDFEKVYFITEISNGLPSDDYAGLLIIGLIIGLILGIGASRS